ncbi:MAG TPA: bifunctional hydroxymethylpyrimidine kinase/phosphomethylpyrimidine kinase, partial [Chitinophagales bacterium]|nr:bifunctional hydroxymethylpyrimidine kinase/phosphomethylpyrimidine kinase [Chitinophagales bacterium]
MKTKTRPYVLSIAGYDPCGGAGVLSDIKTMEAIGVYGLAVTTCITYQNDHQFEGVQW